MKGDAGLSCNLDLDCADEVVDGLPGRDGEPGPPGLDGPTGMKVAYRNLFIICVYLY